MVNVNYFNSEEEAFLASAEEAQARSEAHAEALMEKVRADMGLAGSHLTDEEVCCLIKGHSLSKTFDTTGGAPEPSVCKTCGKVGEGLTMAQKTALDQQIGNTY